MNSTTYAYDGSTLLATIDQALVNGTATGTPITRYVSPDNLGSTNITTDTSGNLAQWLDYYPYGAVRIDQDAATTSAARTYIGQYSDASGLSYLQNRYYNPSQGQFLTQDPVFLSTQQNLQDPQSLNPYSYSDDNPITREDPNGNLFIDLNASYAPSYGGGSGAVSIPSSGYIFAANGVYSYPTTSISPDGGRSFSIGIAPGSVPTGPSQSFSGYGPDGWGGQVSLEKDKGSNASLSGEVGFGTPGVAYSVSGTPTYLASYPQILGALGGPLVYETTPATTLNTTYYSNPQSMFSYNSLSNAFQQVSQQSQSLRGSGSSFTGSQVQALGNVASSFGVSSLNSTQVSAALAVKAAFSSH